MVSGTGHAGMEAAIANLVEPGEKVVVGNKVRRALEANAPMCLAFCSGGVGVVAAAAGGSSCCFAPLRT